MVHPLKSSDLRIHNLVHYKGKPKWVHMQELIDIESRNFDYTPIELTPDILKKCGFENVDGWYANGDEIDVDKYKRGDFEVLCAAVGELVFLYRDKELDHIKYLHQLQNLYYTLFGIELQVKL